MRSDSVGRFKLKPRHTIDAAVIGFTEGTDDRRGMVHDLLIALFRPDGCLHVVGHVGGGFSNDERRGFLSDLKDRIVESDYVEVNDQVAYHMVRPEWVIEVSVLDLIAETTRGLPINKMALHWDAAGSRYRIVRRMPLVGMISPQFVRRREDKSVHPADIPLRQVTELVDVPLADRDARQLDLPQSEVLRREVCTQRLKGQTMVRKLLMWKTNKETSGEDLPGVRDPLHGLQSQPQDATRARHPGIELAPADRTPLVGTGHRGIHERMGAGGDHHRRHGCADSIRGRTGGGSSTCHRAPAKPRKRRKKGGRSERRHDSRDTRRACRGRHGTNPAGRRTSRRRTGHQPGPEATFLAKKEIGLIHSAMDLFPKRPFFGQKKTGKFVQFCHLHFLTTRLG